MKTLAIVLASALSVTSNTAVVKGWRRDPLTFDPVAQTFSNTNFPSAAEAEGARLVAESLPGLLAAATDALATNLAPVMARLDEQRRRPVVLLAGAAATENVVDRRNLTMVVVSNEIVRTGDALTVRAWVHGNKQLASPPVVRLRMLTDMGRSVEWIDAAWDRYGRDEAAVEVESGGESYECYLLTATFPAAPTNMPVRLRPWLKIGTARERFDFGNRQLRINGVMACTTNDLSFLGQFYTTNGVPLEGFTPYADRGDLRFAESEEEESK